MRRRLTALLFLAMLVLSAAAPAQASAAAAPPPDVEVPIFPIATQSKAPAGFDITPVQAIALAKRVPQIQQIHGAHHPLQIKVLLWVKNHYEVDFYFHGKALATQSVMANGRIGPTFTGPLVIALYARGHYARKVDSPWVFGPFTALFLFPLLMLRRRSWLDRLDIAAVLSFGLSYALFNHAHLEPAVWLAYPPMLYLLARMLIRGFRSRPLAGRLDCRLPTVVLVIGLLLLIGGRIFLALTNQAGVIDVGEASLLGAYKILHGQSIYYYSLGHGDTYGPINYLAYVPFLKIWPGPWGYAPAARAATITFDLLTIGGLVLFGWRLRRGRDGVRLGLLLAWLWAACPFSLLDVAKNTNDGLVALLVVLVMLTLTSPIKRGFLVGLAAAAKWFPAILLPLVAVGRGEEDQSAWRKVLAGFAIALGASIAAFLPSGGLIEVWNHTIGFQLSRPDIFSIWALHPTLAPIKVAIEAGVVVLALVVAFRPRGRRSPAQVSALAAALIIAVQLPALHWFYLYIVWFLPLVLIAVLATDASAADAPHAPEAARELDLTDAPPALAGVA